MSELKPPHDPIDALGQAYELVLERSMEKAQRMEKQAGQRLHHLIDAAHDEVAELTRLSREGLAKVAVALKRDLDEAARFMSETGKGLHDWWGFESTLLGEQLREDFKRAADQTTLELQALAQTAQRAEYRTGELTGPGTLRCDACGERVHFHRPGRIPPCPKCHASRYHRRELD